MPSRTPGYLPFRHPLRRAPGPVPNEAKMFWPQGQLAPAFLPAGGPSFQPLSFHGGTAQLIFQNDIEPGIEEEYAGVEGESSDWMQKLLIFAAGVGAGYLYCTRMR